ncbi:MAG: hypothetical protein K8U57_27335 [Planctomycetes bacterium]|nr:hypothetical protein [Planctomycetota bacterium]
MKDDAKLDDVQLAVWVGEGGPDLPFPGEPWPGLPDVIPPWDEPLPGLPDLPAIPQLPLEERCDRPVAAPPAGN